MKKTLIFLLLVIFITSCGSKFSLQKRRYCKGIYFETARATHKSDQKLKRVGKHKQAEKEEIVQSVLVQNQEEESKNSNTDAIQLQSNKKYIPEKVRVDNFIAAHDLRVKELEFFGQNKVEKKSLTIKRNLAKAPGDLLIDVLILTIFGFFCQWLFNPKDGDAKFILKIIALALIIYGSYLLILGSTTMNFIMQSFGLIFIILGVAIILSGLFHRA